MSIQTAEEIRNKIQYSNHYSSCLYYNQQCNFTKKNDILIRIRNCYDNIISYETKIIENKTYSGLVNFMDKQKVISEKSFIEYLLSSCITYKHDTIVNGIEFVKKEKVDFEKEGLPMHKI